MGDQASEDWKLLLVDDDEEDYILTKDMLNQAASRRFLLDWAPTYQQGQQKLQSSHYNAVLVDYDLGGRTGIDLIRETAAQGYPSPLILYTGRGSYEVDMEAMRAGASFYLAKGDMNPLMLERFIRYAVERKRIEQERYHILESIQDAFFSMDQNWTITYMNRRAAHNGGIEPEQAVGKNFWEVFPKVKGTPVEKQYRRVMEERTSVQFETPGIYQDTFYSVKLYPSIDGISMFAQDISEQKRAEQLLAFHASLLDNIHDAVYSTDLEPRIISWNKAAEQMYGYTAQEALGQNPAKLLRSEFSEEQRLAAFNQIEQAGFYIVEVAHYTKDGRQVIVDASAMVRRDGQGKIIGFVNANRDITERRKAEEALRASEAEFRALTTASAQVLYRMNADWTEMRRLQGGAFLADTTRPNRNWLADYIHPEDQPGVLEMIKKSVQTGTIFEMEHRVLRADGTLGWTASRAIPVYGSQGEIVEWFGAASDITARKQAEGAVQSLAKYPSEDPNPVIRAWADGSILFANHASQEVLKAWGSIDSSSVPGFIQGIIQQTLKTGVLQQLEQKIGSKTFLFSIAPIKGSRYVNMYGMDISERKRAQHALHLSQERYRVAVLNSHGIFAQTDRQLRYTWIHNPHPDFQPDQVIGRRDDELEDNPGTRQLVALKQHVLESGVGFHGEVAFSRSDGDYTYDMTIEPLCDPDGTLTGVTTAAFDITSHLKMVTALREVSRSVAEERDKLDAILANLPVGVWIADQNGRFIQKNEMADRIWAGDAPLAEGVEEYHQYTGWFPESGKSLQPDDYPMVIAQKTGQPVGPLEFKIRRFDGSEGTVLVSAAPIHNGTGQLTGVVGINMDITQRKQIEQALQYAEERFDKVFHASPNPKIISRMNDGRIEVVNQAFLQLFGISRDEAIGKTSLDLGMFTNPADREKAIQQLQAEKSVRDYQMEISTKSGKKHHVSLSMEIIPVGEENFMLKILQDLSDH